MRCAWFVPERRVFSRCFREEFLGLELLRVELPRRKGAQRRVLRRLGRAGVELALNLPPLERYPTPCPRLADVAPLYQRRAAELALWALERWGLRPETCAVGLWGRRWNREMRRAAEALVPRVKALALSLEREEKERRTAAALMERWGVSVLHGAGEVTLCFSPCPPGETRLPLWEGCGPLEGLTWRWEGGQLPEGVPADALLCVLGSRGRIGWEEVWPQHS